jgi:hypothetical protein
MEIKYKTTEVMKTFGLQPETIPFNSESVEGTEEYAIFVTNKGTKLKFGINGNTHWIEKIN